MMIHVTAYPFATVNGTIEVPDDIDENNISEYVSDHFDDIEFDESDIDLDYAGTDLECSVE